MKEYIEREAAIDDLTAKKENATSLCKNETNPQAKCIAWGMASGFTYAIGSIEGIPAADVRPVTYATWEEGSGDWLCGTDATKDYKCSNCKSEFVEDGKYCPECGATMRKEK